MELSGGFLIRANEDGTTQVTNSIRFDIKLGALSPSVQDLAMKKFAALFLPMMGKQAAKFEVGGKLEQVPCSVPDVYAELDRRLAHITGPG